MQTGELAMYSHWAIYVATALLMISGILALWFLYRFKHLNNAINSLAMGVLCTVFFAGLSFPSINHEIGFEVVSKKATEMAEKQNTTTDYSYGIRRPDSMDVFLHHDIFRVEPDDILNNVYSNAVLIITERRLRDNEALQAYISDKPTDRVGKYIIVGL